ncbi:MAG TPA: transcriptional regulator [Terriglobales bacterium]|nr:transcriptional regulator [Terriglobales bacterium]
MIDHIVIDPRNTAVIFTSAWNVKDQKSGDVFRSHDGGKTWVALPDMREKSVRALAMAPSDSNVLAAGAFDGVYLSKDGGDSWQRISRANLGEIRNIESVTIDPNNPNIIYAGTWHLAWKTEDGGITWHRINQGMIDDSDVFSVIVDSTNPSVVYASACSGIYKSDIAGEFFQKVDGIPFSARRTRVLKQDPNNHNVVYAGTTQGLWKTIDAGKAWKQVTDSKVVVNDIMVDPRNSSRLLLATDRGGVMVSDNGGLGLSPSNAGYTHRYITTILPAMNDPDMIFVGIANDLEWGGVFSLRDDETWQQRSAGLGGRDVFALAQTTDGTLIAGTNRGLFTLSRDAGIWRPSSIKVTKSSPSLPRKTLKSISLDLPPAPNSLLDARINDIEVRSHRWLVATSAGLFSTADDGRTWNGGPVLGRENFVAVRSAGSLLVAATHTEILISADDGSNWQVADLPLQIAGVRGLAVTPEAEIVVASLEGAFRSSNCGKSWEHTFNGLPERDLSSISYDAFGRTLLATSLSADTIFQSHDGGQSWSHGPDLGYPLRRVAIGHGRFVAVTSFDGIITQK